MAILRFYALNALDAAKTASVLQQLQQVNAGVVALRTEKCYHVELDTVATAGANTEAILNWLFKHPQKAGGLTRSTTLQSTIDAAAGRLLEIEVGPRFNFSTAQSTNSVSICQNVGLAGIRRIEVSIKYQLQLQPSAPHADIPAADAERLFAIVGDRMTQCRYTEANMPRASFDEQLPSAAAAAGGAQSSWYTVPVMSEGRAAIERVNRELGLSFDEWDIEFYTQLFGSVLKRDATSVELFDCAQSNSEHSRHWFFKGLMVVDGVPQPKSLIQMIGETQCHSNANNTIAFSDNSSAIRGFRHAALRPTRPDGPAKVLVESVESDLIFTAETHNMPTAVAPFSGATTGTGGRIRDVQGVGRGGHTLAGTAGYCVGRLHVPGYEHEYEGAKEEYPASFAEPLRVIIEASNGASDYGNKFGEPVVAGFAVSYGVHNAAGEREEYVKPIMFSAGLGTMDSAQTKKLDPERGQLLAKIGGPVYRIGVGGGAASSVEVQGSQSAELDFNAVQRGDAEMENKLNRVVRACIELGEANPILAIHDQGAGGNGNVLKELVEPGFAGAVIFSKEFQLGDPTITALELWGAEYQENNAVLVRAEDRTLLERICERERCPVSFVGVVSGTGLVTLVEAAADFENIDRYSVVCPDAKPTVPFNMHLRDVLGEMPRKEYQLERRPQVLRPLQLGAAPLDYAAHLRRVLSVMTVASKRFLTNKVDRCVTGLIAQQQCVGPLHTPLADFACTAVGHFGCEGIATSIGTQPSKGLISAAAGARMSVAEAVSNLAFVRISELADVKCSGNWMWAAKLPGEGAKMYDACVAMCELMGGLRIAVDGGKDSLSMAARVGDVTVKSPGTLVISTYVQCPDVRVKVTPDLKAPQRGESGQLVWVNIEGKFRLGGSVLAQAYGQQGDDVPDIERPETLHRAFNVTQTLLAQRKLLAGHDCSDGGLVVCLLEMAFAGLCGLEVDLGGVVAALPAESFRTNGSDDAALAMLFGEECGWVLEVPDAELAQVLEQFGEQQVPAYHIGQSVGKGLRSPVRLSCDGRVLLAGTTLEFFKQWERTSFELEKLQMNAACAEEEFGTYDYRQGPHYEFAYRPVERPLAAAVDVVRVAVIREEGTNGDREMMATLLQAGFEVHDVTMADLLAERAQLDDRFRGVVFPGGFSYADTLGSAKGWAAGIMWSERVAPQFARFRARKDTWSLGVCNGCQLMALIGWVGGDEANATGANVIEVPDVALLENRSGRYECRWVTVKVPTNRSIMLRRLAGSQLGCWIAHGEGRFSYRNGEVRERLLTDSCVALRYVDDGGAPTEVYPMNPNGSADGVAGVCSADGRHLAMMPHPERCSQLWQWPYVAAGFEPELSPWQCMFNEAYEWCLEGADK